MSDHYELGYGEGSPLYNEFPPIIIGGPSGDYEVVADVESARWVEFSIVSIANGTQGIAYVVASGRTQPRALDYSGATTINKDSKNYGQAYVVDIVKSLTMGQRWHRVTHSQKKVMIRIDCVGGGAVYVTLQFRARILERIPGPSMQVHPDHAHQMNVSRADTVNQRLAAAGIPGYVEEANNAR